MAVLGRRTWATMLTEHVNRMGRTGDTGYTARAHEFIASAYFDICTKWHHFELDTRDTSSLTCSTSTNIIDASSLGIHGIFGIQLRDPTSDDYASTPEWEEAHFSLQKYANLNREPLSYTRFGDEIMFPVIPKLAYPVTIHYYADATAPDFSSGSPQLAREWDEHIMELSLAYAHGSLWQLDLAGYFQGRFDKWAESVTNPLLASVPLHGRPELQTRSYPHGGAQG